MADEDFFKDYPPVSGGDAAAPSGPAIPLGPADDTNPFESGDEGDASGRGDSPAHASEALNGNGGHIFGAEADGEDDGDDDGTYGGPPPEDEAPECPAVAAWRAEFAAGLEQKVLAEREGKAEKAERAKETLEKMHAGWEKRAKDTADANKGAEKELIRDRDGIIARMSKPGEPPAWGVVPELVDMSGKFKEGARDTSRMRQVLLKLKTY